MSNLHKEDKLNLSLEYTYTVQCWLVNHKIHIKKGKNSTRSFLS